MPYGCGISINYQKREGSRLHEAGLFLASGSRATGASDEAPPQEQVGATIGRYKLLQEIGEGGFGVVYLAEQKKPVRRKVALKGIAITDDCDRANLTVQERLDLFTLVCSAVQHAHQSAWSVVRSRRASDPAVISTRVNSLQSPCVIPWFAGL